MLRIRAVEPLEGYSLSLTLTDGSLVARSVEHVLTGPVFEPLPKDDGLFRSVTVQDGTVVWPGGADLDPDVLIWGGAPPEGETVAPPAVLSIVEPSRA